MNDTTLRNELDAMMNMFDEQPEQREVDWKRYKQITELQEQRLYEELSKRHYALGTLACDVNELMNAILP